MSSQATAFVTRTAVSLNAQTVIVIAVDTAYVGGQGGQQITRGIYVMDNRVNNGSTGEGTLGLSTRADLGDLIAYNSVPINPNSGDTVVITGFIITEGSVFGSSGYPIQQPPIGNEPAGSYWIGQSMNAGQQTYQIQLELTVGQLRPVRYFVDFGPCTLTAE